MRARLIKVAAIPVIALCAATLASCGGPLPPPPPDAPYLGSNNPVPLRVEDLLGRMTPEEKYGQMALMERLYVSPEEITSLGLGGIVPAISYPPDPNTARDWADLRRAPTARAGDPTAHPAVLRR